MPTLPTPIDHRAALDRAHWWVTEFQQPMQGDFLGGRAPFDRDAGHACARQMLKAHAMWHSSNLINVCNMARAGWLDAEMALWELSNEFENRGKQMPAYLQNYIIELANPNRLRPFRPKGKQKADRFIMDIAICAIIIELIGKHGLNATRRKTSAHPSACSIVAKALAERGLHRGDERAIEKVWENYSPGLTKGLNWDAVRSYPEYMTA